MFDENEPKTKNSNDIALGCDLSTFSIGDIHERVEMLKLEITRLETDMKKKKSNYQDAHSFFKN